MTPHPGDDMPPETPPRLWRGIAFALPLGLLMWAGLIALARCTWDAVCALAGGTG